MKRCDHTAKPEVSEEERASQLAMLRNLAVSARGERFMGELAPALLRMLNAGQITFEVARCSGKEEKVFVAVVTPTDVAGLLPLVTHAVPYFIFSYFLEGLVHIGALKGCEKKIPFTGSDELLNGTPVPPVYRSCVADPATMEGATRRYVSENALARRLGSDAEPAADGWLRLCIGDQSVGVSWHATPDAPLVYASPADLGSDIVVVTFPDPATKIVHFLGWTTRGAFRKKCRRVNRDGAVQYVLPQSKLFPFDKLLTLAARYPARTVQ